MHITRKELAKRIKARDLPAALLCYGEEAFFHEEILTALRANYGGAGSWGYEVVDAALLDPAQLLASAGTLSFGGETKVTVLRSAHKLKKDQLQALERVASHPAKVREVLRDVLRVVVMMAEKELKATDNLLKWAKGQKITVCHLVSPKPSELTSWLKTQASSKGFSLDDRTVDFMIDLSAGNLMALAQMLTKIDLYRGEGDRVGLKDVEDLLHDSFEKGVYDCVRAVFARDRDRASRELHRVLRFDSREGMLQIIRALSREAFALLKYHELKGRVPSEEMAKELRLGSRRWLLSKEYPERARRWPAERLHRFLMRLAEVDLAVRTTGRDAEAMLEQVVIGNLAPTSVEEFDEVFL
ncbi:DNA polymerase III subunit delta [candidate division TA06 bacterium B3_TA06]|uniref:DNA-directed DNA polymerase n=1 Tax=candidate division TA06 bacterium B3_TA06 TaxID=2012487 RepID=A0A532V5Z7_UNCT6|nr:MAG: DNA polymerase III subunit delta [candidate division TA06 bacterium B3_TA06]